LNWISKRFDEQVAFAIRSVPAQTNGKKPSNKHQENRCLDKDSLISLPSPGVGKSPIRPDDQRQAEQDKKATRVSEDYGKEKRDA
jgi:hypothetical protein